MPPTHHRLRACTACTKAKRPCNKRLPRCERCVQKGVLCKYPPARQTAWDYALANEKDGEAQSAESTPAAISPAGQGSTSDTMPSDAGSAPKEDFNFRSWLEASMGHCSAFAPPELRVHGELVGLAAAPSFNLSSLRDMVLKCTIPRQEDWFYSPEAWEVTRTAQSELSSDLFDLVALKQFVKTIQEWVRRWGTTGRCPFIHHRLYNRRFPSVVQDAYTALAAYNSRTAETTELCFRIIQDRVARLVEDNLCAGASTLAEPTMVPMLDPFDHLARVQALLVYETIGLLDGDITLRETAERYMPTLTQWAKEMWDSAELDSNIHSAISDLDAGSDDPGLARPTSGEDAETASWNCWIVSESIRRTWITANLTRSVYSVLKTGWTSCSGGVRWTARAGVWETDDAYTWKDAVGSGSSPLFVPSYFADVLFNFALPDEVDEFGHAILGAQYGLEKVAKWKALAKRRAR